MADTGGEKLDLSVIMPCLNEEQTVGICIEEAKSFMRQNELRGEILVVDNGLRTNRPVWRKNMGPK